MTLKTVALPPPIPPSSIFIHFHSSTFSPLQHISFCFSLISSKRYLCISSFLILHLASSFMSRPLSLSPSYLPSPSFFASSFSSPFLFLFLLFLHVIFLLCFIFLLTPDVLLSRSPIRPLPLLLLPLSPLHRRTRPIQNCRPSGSQKSPCGTSVGDGCNGEGCRSHSRCTTTLPRPRRVRGKEWKVLKAVGRTRNGGGGSSKV